jgi:hypothetical protein
MRPVIFDVTGIGTEEELRFQVSETLKRGLPEVKEGLPKAGTLKVLANGPSAEACPLYGPTLALNGALGLFTRKGLAPAYWAACDPQELVAAFLSEAPKGTTYLVADKCHPKVFVALANHNVQTFHLNEIETEGLRTGPTFFSGLSITMSIFAVMYWLGWRRFEVWGWDCCYYGAQSHAVSQEVPPGTVQIQVGNKLFCSTPTWAAEAQAALQFINMSGLDINIRGNGLLAEIWRNRAKVAFLSEEPLYA